MTAIEVGNEDKPIIELSTNYVVGLTNPITMEVKGKIKDETVIVLLDCGATLNFISEKLVHSLNLPTRDTSDYGVILGSGAAIRGKGICGNWEG